MMELRKVTKHNTQFKAVLNALPQIRCEQNGFRFILSEKAYKLMNLDKTKGVCFYFDDLNKKAYLAVEKISEFTFNPVCSKNTGYRFTSKFAWLDLQKTIGLPDGNQYLQINKSSLNYFELTL